MTPKIINAVNDNIRGIKIPKARILSSLYRITFVQVKIAIINNQNIIEF